MHAGRVEEAGALAERCDEEKQEASVQNRLAARRQSHVGGVAADDRATTERQRAWWMELAPTHSMSTMLEFPLMTNT